MTVVVAVDIWLGPNSMSRKRKLRSRTFLLRLKTERTKLLQSVRATTNHHHQQRPVSHSHTPSLIHSTTSFNNKNKETRIGTGSQATKNQTVVEENKISFLLPLLPWMLFLFSTPPSTLSLITTSPHFRPYYFPLYDRTMPYQT